jgi:predicted RND superfamily exporter protein
VGELQNWLIGISSIGGVYSIVDYLDLLQEAFSEELDLDDSDERSKSLNSALLLFGGGVDADRYADLSFQETIIRVKTSLIKTKELTQLIALIQDRIDNLPLEITGHVTGSSSLIAKTIDNISRGQLISLAFALLSIYLILLLLFRSWRIALIALLPNALPLSAYFGYLGITGTPLNMTTSMVSAVVLGIAIDDSVHFLTRFKREYEKCNSSYIAIKGTLESVGRPVTLTTIALCSGFITLSFGELQNQLEFGLLAAGCLFLAWLVDITFTPAICSFFSRFLQAQ